MEVSRPGLIATQSVDVFCLIRRGGGGLSAAFTSSPTVGLGCFEHEILQKSRNFCSDQLFFRMRLISLTDRINFVIV